MKPFLGFGGNVNSEFGWVQSKVFDLGISGFMTIELLNTEFL